MEEAPRLRLEFQLTPDDLREANRAHNMRGFIRIGVIVSVIVLLNGWQMFHNAATEQGGATDRATAVVVTLIVLLPWLLMFAGVWWVVFRLLGGGVQKIWESSPTLRLPRAVEVDQNGMWLVDSLIRSECQWGAFPKYRETPNLFMLYLNRESFHLIPKRAFANAEALAWFRAAVQNHVRR